MLVEVYVDGACRGNGKKDCLGGWGVYITCNGKSKTLKGYALDTTNNQMELQAAINALKMFLLMVFNNIIKFI